MRYSKFFGKTMYEPPKEATLVSHKLLVQGGFIRESVAGRYFFLPLGMRVRNNIINIIRDEMNKAGFQEMLSPTLHPLELWQESNRDNAGNFGLMLVKDQREALFALGGTGEEMFTDVVRKFQISYKDLPIYVYQLSEKFRDELRARGGLLRVREFTMKDAYSFDRDEESFKQTYDLIAEVYFRIFERLGLEAKMIPADSGYMGGSYSHEFVVETEAGESTYLISQDGKYVAHEDVASFKLEQMNPDEEIKEMEIIDQPEWVQTMEDNVKHYGQPAWRYLKNVVYKNVATGEIIIAVIRGDLDVNKTKLERHVGAPELLEEASSEDLEKLGTKTGYVHSWGHTARYIGDKSLQTVRNFIGGQKAESSDTINVNYGRDFETDELADIALAKEGYASPDTGSELVEYRGVEVGNLFQLGYHYSEKMKNATYVDSDGTEKPYYMGSYGIGIGRTLATIVELYHDEKGIVWPKAVAPFAVHLIALNIEDNEVKTAANTLYQELVASGVDVLYDDREDSSPGQKLNDADLIGIPVRLVVSKKTVEGSYIELKERSKQEAERLSDVREVLERMI